MSDRPDIEPHELQLRVIYSSLRPAVRLARRFGIGIQEMKEWLELAYYHELKSEGLTLDEAAEVSQVSRRKIAQLSKRLKTNFFNPERSAGLPRRIEFMLWAGPLTEGRIRAEFREVPDDDVTTALDQLVREERVVVERGRTDLYRVPKSEFRLYAKNWIARIDGLNNHFDNVLNTVVGRFFLDDPRAFHRTLNFRIRPQDYPKLTELYDEVIFPRLAALDESAREGSEALGLSVSWAPDYANLPTEPADADSDAPEDP